jgi:hypothetical protein
MFSPGFPAEETFPFPPPPPAPDDPPLSPTPADPTSPEPPAPQLDSAITRITTSEIADTVLLTVLLIPHILSATESPQRFHEISELDLRNLPYL